MKTQIQKPSEGKARYTREYKQETLDFWRRSGRSAAKVAAELGIRAPLLYRWAKQLRDAAEHGGVSELEKKRTRLEDLQAEIRHLRTPPKREHLNA